MTAAPRFICPYCKHTTYSEKFMRMHIQTVHERPVPSLSFEALVLRAARDASRERKASS